MKNVIVTIEKSRKNGESLVIKIKNKTVIAEVVKIFSVIDLSNN